MNNRWMAVAVVAVLILFSAVVLKGKVVSADTPMTTLVASAPAPQDGDSVQPAKNGPPVPWKNGPPVPWKNGPPVPWNR